MIRPQSISPLLVLLVQRAHRSVRGRLGVAVDADPWCGMGLLVAQVPDGDRSPRDWVRGWRAAARESYSAALNSPLVQAGKRESSFLDPLLLPSRDVGVGRPMVTWESLAHGQTSDDVRFGVKASPKVQEWPAGLKTVGVVMEYGPGGFELQELDALLSARDHGIQAWAELPGEPEAWSAWSDGCWGAVDKVGAAVWAHPPVQDHWNDYGAFLERAILRWCQDGNWEQWMWPAADLLQQAIEEAMLNGTPSKKEAGPWPAFPGRCRHPDWGRLRRQLWAATQRACGGAGALEDVIVGIVLADRGLVKTS